MLCSPSSALLLTLVKKDREDKYFQIKKRDGEERNTILKQAWIIFPETVASPEASIISVWFGEPGKLSDVRVALSAYEMKNMCCIFERLFKLKKNAIFPLRKIFIPF